MNLARILTALGVALQAGGAATTGTLSSVLHIIGAAALFLAQPQKVASGEKASDAPPTGA